MGGIGEETNESMSYIPNTDEDVREMLRDIGCGKVEDLFTHIPENLRYAGELDLPKPLSEPELMRHMKTLSIRNCNLHEYSSFIGGGLYNHYIPPAVSRLASRSEFSTSYTPYQPEVSQGTLQAIFEYQSLMCMLMGMDVCNASVYDGATSAAEAVLMSLRINRRSTVILSRTLNPQYRAVIEAYVKGHAEIVEVPYNREGVTDSEKLAEIIDETVSCVVLQSPNFFGVLEDGMYEKVIHGRGALFISVFSEPLAFGIINPPGVYDADIACGEGQSLGIPPGFGGPLLGILTCKREFVRNMPGRIVGMSVDRLGKRAFVLTLTAREQHIRREKATSNICTNQGLCALTAALYLSALGTQGIRRIGILNHERTEYAKKVLSGISGFRLKFDSPTFNEFVLETDRDLERITQASILKKIIPGLALKKYYTELENCLLVTVTEMNSREEINVLRDALEQEN